MPAPRSTYRLQINADFDLHAAAATVDYLADLGAGAVYLSPLLRAVPGSTHGYDTVDHSQVDPERGGETGRKAVTAAARARGLGVVVDIVPNHMGVRVAAENRWWWDLLTHGSASEHARTFDVDWAAADGRIRLPILADSPDALDDLRIADDELRYAEHRFPIAPGTGEGTPREVHDRQHYELVSWRRADHELNYRRFFAVNELAGVRVEDAAVFEATHGEVLRWVADGDVDGLRVDHPDGLADPAGYFTRLAMAAPGVWVVAEKILDWHETLPPSWPVAGTTGYDALGEVCGVFVDPAGETALTAFDADLAGGPVDFTGLAHTAKREMTDRLLASEVARLARLTPDVAGAASALAELLANFPVYRSYLPYGAERLQAAADATLERRPELRRPVEALLRLLSEPDTELCRRFQQTSGMVMAKGVEDTAFYRWSRFTALNEVGGKPTRFGVSPVDFHSAAAARQGNLPTAMTALSTHDTKRGEDVRARLAVISELPDEWAAAVHRWNERAPLPDLPLAHLLWQAVVGAWPIERARLHAYAQKAAREAGTSTSWTDPDAEFETAMHDLVDRVFDDPELHADISGVAARLSGPGWSNSLAQKITQLTAPGVPDVYQGTELWDLSLVDPDNRRPVDYAARRELLERVDQGWRPPVDATGAAKLLVTNRALRLRRDRPELFTGHTPLAASGPATAHLFAFNRGGAVTVATRLPVGLERRGGWGDTWLWLPGSGWRDVIADRPVDNPEDLADVGELLSAYPVALLVRD